MRVCFSAVAVVLSVVGAAFGGESVSVLNHGQAAPAAAPAVTQAPAAVVVESAPCAQGDCACASGRCNAAPKLYNVEKTCDESCRNRLFGGKVVRKSSRTVYKPVRR